MNKIGQIKAKKNPFNKRSTPNDYKALSETIKLKCKKN